MNEKPTYYAIIPANVRYDKDLSDKAKLLYGEIVALTNKDGYCWASNNYFAELYGTTKMTISRLIKQLVDKGYIESKIIYKKGSKEIDGRYIKICIYPIDKNVKDNNTSINNTMNIKKEYISNDIYSKENAKEDTKEDTKKFIKPTVEDIKEYCNERNNNIDAERFYDYYESNGWVVGKSKMKDWKSAVRNWERNDKKTTTKKNNRSYLDELEEKWKKEGTI